MKVGKRQSNAEQSTCRHALLTCGDLHVFQHKHRLAKRNLRLTKRTVSQLRQQLSELLERIHSAQKGERYVVARSVWLSLESQAHVGKIQERQRSAEEEVNRAKAQHAELIQREQALKTQQQEILELSRIVKQRDEAARREADITRQLIAMLKGQSDSGVCTMLSGYDWEKRCQQLEARFNQSAMTIAHIVDCAEAVTAAQTSLFCAEETRSS